MSTENEIDTETDTETETDNKVGERNVQATFVKRLEGSWKGDARLYSLSAPYSISDWKLDGTETITQVRHVVVSGVTAFDTGQPETYVFASDPDGKVSSWSELPGSLRGKIDHDEAVRGLVEHMSRQ